MALPTQDQINTAVETWLGTFIGIGAIAANTPAYNQIASAIPQLETDIFESIDDVSESYATDTLTFTAGTIADDKIEAGGVYYVPATDLTGSADGSLATPWKVAKGADATAFLANLRKAFNASGVAGTDYSAALTANPLATATASNATTLSARAIAAGAAGNAITASVTVVSGADGFAWGSATFAGGTGDDVPLAEAIIVQFRESLRGGPLQADAAAVDQLDAAMPALNTAVIGSYT